MSPFETLKRWAAWALILHGCSTPKVAENVEPKPEVKVPVAEPEDGYDVEVVQKSKWPKELAEQETLANTVGARVMALENPCLEGNGAGQCYRRALDGFFLKLDGLLEKKKGTLRILHLGDSHIAADYITRTARERLQARFGGQSRGYVHADQRNGFGGRRLDRTGPWKRFRMVDEGQGGQPFGFSGIALESTKSGAKVDYLVNDEDRVVVYFHAAPNGAPFEVLIDGVSLGKVDTKSPTIKTDSKAFSIPKKDVTERKLTIHALGAPVRFFGLSMERTGSGILYDSIGPVGADATSYANAHEVSMKTHIETINPDLVIVMLGGNDALKVRGGKMTLQDVEKAFGALLDRVQAAAPNAECMLWSPMDAGKKEGETIVSKESISEVRKVEREVAKAKGCAFWDMYEAMGGHGSAARWVTADILMQDLVHPKRAGGDLLGHLFAQAFLDAYQPE